MALLTCASNIAKIQQVEAKTSGEPAPKMRRYMDGSIRPENPKLPPQVSIDPNLSRAIRGISHGDFREAVEATERAQQIARDAQQVAIAKAANAELQKEHEMRQESAAEQRAVEQREADDIAQGWARPVVAASTTAASSTTPAQQSYTGQWIDNWQWTTEEWNTWNAWTPLASDPDWRSHER